MHVLRAAVDGAPTWLVVAALVVGIVGGVVGLVILCLWGWDEYVTPYEDRDEKRRNLGLPPADRR